MYCRPVAGAPPPFADAVASVDWSLVAPQPEAARVAASRAPRAMRWSLIVEIAFVRGCRARESCGCHRVGVALSSAEKVEFIVVKRRRRRSTLAGQLFALQLAIIVVVLVAVAAVSLAQSTATFERV